MKKLLLLSFVLIAFSAQSQEAKRLCAINGRFIQPGKEEVVNKIPVDQIESLTTLTSAEGISTYGEFLGSNGMVFIKTSFDASRPLDTPKEAWLTYGDKKPLVLLDGKVVEYETLKKEIPGAIQLIIGGDFVKDYGLQSINGIVKITTR